MPKTLVVKMPKISKMDVPFHVLDLPNIVHALSKQYLAAQANGNRPDVVSWSDEMGCLFQDIEESLTRNKAFRCQLELTYDDLVGLHEAIQHYGNDELVPRLGGELLRLIEKLSSEIDFHYGEVQMIWVDSNSSPSRSPELLESWGCEARV